MTITEIIRKGKGSAGSGNAWRVERCVEGHPLWPIFVLRHYTTEMLRWYTDSEGRNVILYAGTGHGSVSDQNGMNMAFRTLNVPYYFSRKGGATITEVSR